MITGGATSIGRTSTSRTQALTLLHTHHVRARSSWQLPLLPQSVEVDPLRRMTLLKLPPVLQQEEELEAPHGSHLGSAAEAR